MEITTKFLEKAKPYLYVVLLQMGYAGMNIISKITLTRGTSPPVLAVYRHIIAAISIAPFAFIFERSKRPTMTVSIFIKILSLGLLVPAVEQNLYYSGMKLTTASFASAMVNMLPAYSFLVACVLRLEKVNIRKIHSLLKIFGTIVTVGGALVMTLVKGPALTGNQNRNLSAATNKSADSQDVIKGAIFLTIASFCSAGFFNLQAITLKEYPASLSLSALICFVGSIEGAIFAIPMEWHNPTAWAISFDSKLLAAVYSGVVCSALAFTVIGIIMKSKGPVFVTTFCPLGTIMVTIVGVSFLSETLFLGRLIGVIIIISGLYLVLWGKSKDPALNRPNQVENETVQNELPVILDDALRSSKREVETTAAPEVNALSLRRALSLGSLDARIQPVDFV